MDLDFEASYDADSDMDAKSKLRRKLKKERKDAIMSGVKDSDHDGGRRHDNYDTNNNLHLTKRVSTEYAPTQQTTKNMSTDA